MKNGKVTKSDIKCQAIIHYYNNEVLTYPVKVAIKNTADYFYLSESRIWQILRDAN